MVQSSTPRQPSDTRQRLIGAALQLMRRQGYAATSVDEICAEANVTKGSFFHHFTSKHALGRAAVEAWGQVGRQVYSPTWDDADSDPLERLHRFLQIMAGLNTDPDEPCVCMVGMMSQELAQSDGEMRDACATQLDTWSAAVAGMLEEAKRRHPPARDFDATAMAWLLNSIWQGAMLVAKTKRDPGVVVRSLALARDWIDSLFSPPTVPGARPRPA